MASWLVEEVGDVETELAGTARGRGGGGGRGVTVARLRLRSGSRGRGSRRGGRVRERVRERSGLRGIVRGVPGRRGGSQAGREELARLACAPGTQLLRDEGRKTTEGCSGGLGRPAAVLGRFGYQVSAR